MSILMCAVCLWMAALKKKESINESVTYESMRLNDCVISGYFHLPPHIFQY